ncbi:peptidoglycan editing factor PgeF [Clostridium formicaceticum]|uniref:Purine nucleoside phosphorylase n=1 Tax=Clostridium formicaceticum TaxID=1497 RepID=A0AAC9RMA7_9CLOT|nr:peptidoglycan editing factor PgeF [Clostridium formicaceticum]AOY77416.1 multicopper polyphenol oxidase [Clostridium formicaceticum]ARE87970.1 Laccase domain protein [Clostridium formicaceticum]
MSFKIIEEKETKIIIVEEFQQLGMVKHGFSTRIGGVSTAHNSSLNLSFKTKDHKAHVMTNLQRFCEAIDIKVENLVLADQIHRDEIKLVTIEDRGKGIFCEKDYSGVDGLITNVSGIALMTYHADCVPLLFVDPIKKVIAASHAGWRGTALKIGQKTVEKMIKKFECRVEDITVAIGPSIGKCCYEVSNEVVKEFNTNFTYTSNIAFPNTEGKYMLDLWEANRISLKEIGVLDRNIFIANMCTACNTDLFYSHRKEKGLTGRMASVIELTE